MNKAPKFSKVELLIKEINPTDKNFDKKFKLEFNDCGLMITGDYIIVVLDEKDEINNSLTSTGNIFHLKDVASYRTHAY